MTQFLDYPHLGTYPSGSNLLCSKNFRTIALVIKRPGFPITKDSMRGDWHVIMKSFCSASVLIGIQWYFFYCRGVWRHGDHSVPEFPEQLWLECVCVCLSRRYWSCILCSARLSDSMASATGKDHMAAGLTVPHCYIKSPQWQVLVSINSFKPDPRLLFMLSQCNIIWSFLQSKCTIPTYNWHSLALLIFTTV